MNKRNSPAPLSRRQVPAAAARADAEDLAIQALKFIGSDPDRLGRFLALAGIDPHLLRTIAAQPGFLLGVLDHLATDDRLLAAFASEIGRSPEAIMRAREHLGGGERE